jgi:hypothetical protein
VLHATVLLLVLSLKPNYQETVLDEQSINEAVAGIADQTGGMQTHRQLINCQGNCPWGFSFRQSNQLLEQAPRTAPIETLA